MPRVVPFYAVKCYPEPGLLRLLASLGAGFDCASKGELEAVLGLGVAPSRIIFAHPCKRPCDVRFARDHGVAHTTFDTESELHKLAGMYPGARCVLRIRADDPEARVPLGLKYGANPEEVGGLLEVARSLKLEVVGVSFHVGSACKNLATFTTAIEKAREVSRRGSGLVAQRRVWCGVVEGLEGQGRVGILPMLNAWVLYCNPDHAAG
jgi:ornithine decarboxylase